MKVIKLNAIGSTNSYLKDLSLQTSVEDELVLVAESQTKGRGQLDATWQSEAGKSLTFSLFKRFSKLPVMEQASLNFAVSIGLLEALETLKVPNVVIKWPNDILSHQQKMAGILIENQIQGNHIASSVIGIGLNVNETSFKELPQAISMKIATGNTYPIETVLTKVAQIIFEHLHQLEANGIFQLKTRYENNLFRRNLVSTFEMPTGDRKNGKITGVTNLGKLCVLHDDAILKEYGFKEIKLLY